MRIGLLLLPRSIRGATLVESVVALALTSIVITAIVGLVVSAVASSTASKARTTATRYAEEGIEVTRKVRDRTTWNNFWSNYVVGSTKCKPPSHPCGVDSSLNIKEGSDNLTPFTREIYIENGESAGSLQDRSLVTVVVSWTDRGQTDEVRLVTYLSQWRR